MREENNNRDSKMMLIGILSIILGIVALFVIYKVAFANSEEEEEPQVLTEVTNPGTEDGNGTGKENNPTSTETEAKSDITEEMKQVLDSDKFYEGISINGINLAGKTYQEAKEELLATVSSDEEIKPDIKFQVGEELVDMDTTGFSLSNNLDDLLNEAYGIGRNSSKTGDDGLKERYAEIEDLKKNPKSYETSKDVSKTRVSELVHASLDSFEKEVVEANVTGFDLETLTFVIEDSQDGYTIDFDKVTEDVIEAIKNEEYSKIITVEGTVTEPENSAEFLRGYLCKVSSATSTTTSSYNRNVNIDLVCKKLDGLVLQPGEQFDFNSYIGQRTAEAGYREAGGIYNGALRQELGGGICQANAMIFHCVVKADLQVDERSPHTWPSDYVQIGTDATVSWGGPEFKFTNTSDYPIAFHAYYGNQKVTVELYGRPLDDGMYILFKGEEVSRVTAKVEYVADSSMPVGEKETERSAHDQIKAQSYKVYYDKDGNEIKRELAFTSNYPMINKKVRVGTLGPDGVTIFKLDKETGEVTPPEGYVEPTPEPTDEPEPTGNPDPTDSPDPTDTPDPTYSPEPTDTPEVTETPDPTHTPDPTEAPEPTPDDDDDPSQGTEDDNIPWG